jgi:hypothetical protein
MVLDLSVCKINLNDVWPILYPAHLSRVKLENPYCLIEGHKAWQSSLIRLKNSNIIWVRFLIHDAWQCVMNYSHQWNHLVLKI